MLINTPRGSMLAIELCFFTARSCLLESLPASDCFSLFLILYCLNFEVSLYIAHGPTHVGLRFKTLIR